MFPSLVALDLAELRHQDLLREAAAERLARRAGQPSRGARSRVAAALYALASWIDPVYEVRPTYA